VYNANTKQYVLAGQGNGGEYFAYGSGPAEPFKTSGTQTEMPFFVNGGTITEAGDMRHAVDMLLHGKRSS
jgi:hypothetical protein